MRQNLVAKMMILAGLALMFAVALLFIDGVVSERKRYQGEVVSEVAASTAGPQTLSGPALVIRYRERFETTGADGKPVASIRAGKAVVLPETMSVKAHVTVEPRKRGLYSARVYRSHVVMEGAFRVPSRYGLDPNRVIERTDGATAVLGVDDLRGLRKPPTVQWRGAEAKVEPGADPGWPARGVTFDAGAFTGSGDERAPFRIELELVGTEALSVVPVGDNTRVELDSDWPHPSFIGAFLPDERAIDARGFRATWQLSRFATGLNAHADADGDASQRAATAKSFGVRFVQPVDVYQQSERAVKYGMLFVVLTFLVFLLFEVLRRLLIHPIQYGLAGAAVAMFFLLLVSLSEVVAFGLAYAIASAACVGLLTFYVSHVLGGPLRGLGFGGFLAVLYGVLYVLLRIEDYALLVGSILLFAVIAAVMVMTRRVDWYRVGEPTTSA